MLGLCHRITRDHGFLNGWLNRAEVMALEHLGPDLQCDGKMSPCYVPGHVPCHCPLFHSWLQGSIGVLSEIAITSSPTERASIDDQQITDAEQVAIPPTMPIMPLLVRSSCQWYS